MPGRAPMLPRLTSLRWFAALAVFAHHVDTEYNVHSHWPALAPGGAVGVGFFFMLSGFVLTWSARPDDTPRRLWRRRFAKIYPATAVSVLLAVALWWLSDTHITVTPGGTAASFALVQAWIPGESAAANAVTWSLACEAFFYALLPWLLATARTWSTRRVLATAGGGLALAFAVTSVAALAGHADYTYYCPLVRLPEFTAGIALAIAIQRGWRPRIPMPVGVAALAACWTVASVLHSTPAQIQVYVSLPGAVVLILAAAGRDIAGVTGILTTRPMVYLGELSFCFYLVHWLAVSAGSKIAGPLPVFVLAFAAAAALHHGVELPAQARIMRKRQVRPAVCDPDVMVSVSPDATVIAVAKPSH